MRLVRWDPFQNLIAMSNQVNRIFNDTNSPRAEDSVEAWAPPVDVFERGDHLVFRAEIPGVKKEDMDVRIENGVLTLCGERKQESEIKEENAYRMESVYGTFRRSFSLPTTVDASKVTATSKDGILEVTVPKIEAAKPKEIEIKAA
ncbi:MAG: Hsp20/alpha crystallin family protein [Acidobacteriia bacterium]|nr:Hsp20/alpha crystallin family protein [Terriglobia bacterium]